MRRRISWLVVATSSSMVVSFVIPLCLLVQTLAEDRAMQAVDAQARNVVVLVTQLRTSSQLAKVVATLEADGVPATSVVMPSGRVIGAPLPEHDRDLARRVAAQQAGVRIIDEAGGRVLLPVVLGPDRVVVVRSAVEREDLHEGVVAAWTGIIGLGLVLLLAAAVIAARLGARISAPVREVAAVAHRLQDGELSARAEVTGTEETRDLARALNGLAERTTELLATERAAVGDLSHRLRTPVTALRLDAEAVPDPVLGERLQEHIGTLQRSIDAIVKEARRPVRTDLSDPGDATAVARSRVEFWRPLADDQLRALSVTLPETPVLVPLSAEDIADLVDVLIDNVFAHTPEGTSLSISLVTLLGAAELTVADAGPGFGPRDPRVGSTGLGLDIARRTAQGCGGSIEVTSRPGVGSSVVVRLPTV